MKKLDYIDTDTFIGYFKIDGEDPHKNYYELFTGALEKIKEFAIAPYFWYIPNNYQFRLEHVSDNINRFTPYTKEEWLKNNNAEFFFSLCHPDDRVFMLSALHFMASSYLGMDVHHRDNIKFNIYIRMLNKDKAYRWLLMQTMHPSINKQNRLESALFIFYDLSGLEIRDRSLLSVIDYNTYETQYYTYSEEKIQLTNISLKFTKREMEILRMIFQGYNTPQIAKKLFISYYTVENHKRNLRQKTHTKTTGELVAFTMPLLNMNP